MLPDDPHGRVTRTCLYELQQDLLTALLMIEETIEPPPV